MAVGPPKSQIRVLFPFLIRVVTRIARQGNKNAFFVLIWDLWPVLHRTESYLHFQVQTLGKAMDPAKSHSKAIFQYMSRRLARIARQNNRIGPFVEIWSLWPLLHREKVSVRFDVNFWAWPWV